MKNYRGDRTIDGAVVTVDGAPLDFWEEAFHADLVYVYLARRF